MLPLLEVIYSRCPLPLPILYGPGKPENSSISFKVLRSDDGFIPAMNIKLIAGRNFYSNRADSSNYIINEKAMLAMGLTKQNVIGYKIGDVER